MKRTKQRLADYLADIVFVSERAERHLAGFTEQAFYSPMSA